MTSPLPPSGAAVPPSGAASARPRAASRSARAVMGQNQYGKAETRIVKVVRDGGVHRIKDLNVSIALSGDMDDVHYSGSNAAVLPTDTAKNTVYAFAQQYGIESPEQFGMLLARHFVTGQESIKAARIRIEEYAWDRIAGPGRDEGTGHSFVRGGQQTRTAQIAFDGSSHQVFSGLTGLTVMNTTDSEFWGYVKDRYTTLPEAYDRVLATQVTAVWRHSQASDQQPALHWNQSYEQTREHLLQAFAETYSYSLQQTLYQMGARVIDNRPEIDEIRLSLPNQHHFLVDLEPFELKNNTAGGSVYFAADRPYGLIEGTVLRDGTEQEIPVDIVNL